MHRQQPIKQTLALQVAMAGRQIQHAGPAHPSPHAFNELNRLHDLLHVKALRSRHRMRQALEGSGGAGGEATGGADAPACGHQGENACCRT